MRMISDVLMYLDRVYAREYHLPLIYDLGLNVFRDSLIKYNNNEIGLKVIEIIIQYINKSRHGEIIDKFIIKAVIYMFESLTETITPETNVNSTTVYGENYYMRYFEPKLLASSHSYFQDKVLDLLSYHSGTIYIQSVLQLIKDEEARIQLYLPDHTSPRLIDLMDTDLITTNLESIMKLENDGLKSWISDDNYTIMSSLFKLISRVDSNHEMLKRQLRNIITQNGEEMNEKTKLELESKSTEEEMVPVPTNEETSKKSNIPKKKQTRENVTQYAIKWIQNFLQMKAKYDLIIKNSFENDAGLVREIESSFAIFLNSNNRIAEYISLYIDDGIKKSFKTLSQEDVEKILDQSIIVFRFLKDKDVFEKYSKNHMARRLLQQKSMSNDIEMNMITKLKQEIGSSFTSKFEGMFKDIKISQELSSEFKNTISLVDKSIKEVNGGRKLDLDASIITTTFWPMPLNKSLDIVQYPKELQILKDKFDGFYKSKHNGRNLTWSPNFGTVDIRMHYNKKSYEVNMSTYAAIIILSCFGDDCEKQEYTFDEIFEITQIPKPDLVRHLQSISVASRSRLLKKTPMSKEINPNDVFTINEQFKSPQTKIKVLTVSSGSKLEDDSQRSETMEQINKSRIIETEAAIVRTMKARRELKHQELVNEVIKQLISRFKPQPSFIKHRIEELIEKEYLKRNDDDLNVYTYLA
ncbi:hypothetical protein CANARDRAFT_25939 [[Candida] arabinofermentans NRRL YB-2248]|uniref:Cullin family profile domain-containing protein n=1 Tax=[Candida] arabinofermentans NRRL YB-2248 TaxID=983967 RepID=A0A1E4T7S8_9ASCO|nr:hypothetical protein CANARDRAFT_25939 [[Candida] arabinofermentans NRRL YB-2248]